MVRSFRGAQRLKILRTEDGQVDGHLECSVFLDFGSRQPFEFEDRLPAVPVSYVLNPQHGVFLADEVQRLMRIGIGSWLQVELRPDRVVDCDCDGEKGWTVLFRLPLPDGCDCDLYMAVGRAATGSDAVNAALEYAAGWIKGLDRRPLDEDLAELLGTLDLVQAPLFSCGLALLDPLPISSTAT